MADDPMCHACRHPRRQHGGDGCVRGDCWCDLTPADLERTEPTEPTDDELAAEIDRTEEATELEAVDDLPPLLPVLVSDGTRPLPPLPDSAYPPAAQPLEPAEPQELPASPVSPLTQALMWWDAWYCRTCYSRYFTERRCCGCQAGPVRVLVVAREVSGG